MGESLRAKEGSLAGLIKDMHWSIQLEALRSLGKIGKEALPALIDTMARHQDLDFREEAAREIIDIKCAQFMIELLREDERLEVLGGVYPQVISTGESGTEDALIEALNAYGDLNMARDFLESKNEKLERAALDWMRRNGHNTPPKRSGRGPQWGEKSKENCEAAPEIKDVDAGVGRIENKRESRRE